MGFKHIPLSMCMVVFKIQKPFGTSLGRYLMDDSVIINTLLTADT